MLAGWLIDWRKWDADGGVIQSPLARSVLYSSFAVTIVCVGLYLWFRHVATKHEKQSD
jgi:hypothetical protein